MRELVVVEREKYSKTRASEKINSWNAGRNKKPVFKKVEKVFTNGMKI